MGKLHNSVTNIVQSGIKLVSWDVDGTLFSYKRLAFKLLRNGLRNIFVAGWSSTVKNLREVFEFHRTVEFQRLNTECEVNPAHLIRFKAAQEREKETLRIALNGLPPRSNVIGLIQKFAQNGIVQVALSDFECEYKLEALGLRKHFEKAYSCEEIGFWKPSPIPLSKVQDDFGVLPEQHLHIGDRSSTDGLACERNGCQFLYVKHLLTLPKEFDFFI
ncbi:HAD family hydrolase [bacterium]|nr:HAD family hydrolase [bacterium]MCI0612467.1 HAD family hydrolase [bacterium]